MPPTTLSTGTRLGPYEILSALGAGGMGEVYRATDTNLKRQVAIKVLPASMAADAERLARFQREAEVLAALNHPNIAHIHGLEKSDGTIALVMELVEGPTLADRIAHGPIPINEALPIAKQIAEALEAAHEQGIIHRDLKPANIKVRDEGTVKVLDFGLAKLVAPDVGGSGATAGLSQSPTITSPALMTGVGMILGTAAYMSPEQAKGRAADRRSDIWAFGCVLYEMLTGKRAFEGEDITDTIAAVVRAEPNWGRLPPDTPPAIRPLLRRCLEKDRRERLPDVAMARLEIKDALAKADADGLVTSSSVPVVRRGRERLAWMLVGLTAVVTAISVAAVTYLRHEPADTRVYRSAILPPANLTWDPAGRLALSPDGRRLAFLAPAPNGRRALWVQPLDGFRAQALADTDGATYPFWSADSRFLAFIADGKLKKIDASGGPALTICQVSGFGTAPGTWNRDNVILFTTGNSSIDRVAATGGTPAPVTVLDAKAGETRHLFPFFLPDGRHFLYVAYRGQTPRGVYVGSLDSTDRTRLLDGGSNVAYAQGFLIFLREQTLMAQPFDITHLVLTGDAMPLAERVFSQPLQAGTFSVAESGVLVYQSTNADEQLEWVDRSGKTVSTLGARAVYREVQLSPDGARVSVTLNPGNGQRSDIWIVDVAQNVPTRLTFDPADDGSAVWSPDGRWVAFRSNRQGPFDLYQRASSGAGAEELLIADAFDKTPTSWSSDGRFILYTVSAAGIVGDVWVLPVSGDRKPFPFLKGPFTQGQSQFSPDGRWVAYMSNETGRPAIYVVPFPGPGGKWMVSTDVGQQPRWRRDGKEIFYLDQNNLMAASVTTNGARFEVGAARSLFALPSTGGSGRYDVSADGLRFLIRSDYAEDKSVPITLVTNWAAALNK